MSQLSRQMIIYTSFSGDRGDENICFFLGLAKVQDWPATLSLFPWDEMGDTERGDHPFSYEVLFVNFAIMLLTWLIV